MGCGTRRIADGRTAGGRFGTCREVPALRRLGGLLAPGKVRAARPRRSRRSRANTLAGRDAPPLGIPLPPPLDEAASLRCDPVVDTRSSRGRSGGRDLGRLAPFPRLWYADGPQ